MTATDDGMALYAAILAHPAEDTPRLVYADWLQEHGQEIRAEYIRLAVANHSHTTTLLAGQALGVDRKWKFWREEWPAVYVELFKAPYRPKSFYYTLFRGFVSRIKGDAADWLAYGDTIRAQHPVTHVTLANMSGWDARLTQFDSHDADENFTCPRWPNVKFELPKIIEANWHSPVGDPLLDLQILREQMMRDIAHGSSIAGHAS